MATYSICILSQQRKKELRIDGGGEMQIKAGNAALLSVLAWAQRSSARLPSRLHLYAAL